MHLSYNVLWHVFFTLSYLSLISFCCVVFCLYDDFHHTLSFKNSLMRFFLSIQIAFLILSGSYWVCALNETWTIHLYKLLFLVIGICSVSILVSSSHFVYSLYLLIHDER